LLVHEHGFDIMGGEKRVKVTASAAYRNGLTQLGLGTREIDRGMHVAVQSPRMVQEMQNPHRNILSYSNFRSTVTFKAGVDMNYALFQTSAHFPGRHDSSEKTYPIYLDSIVAIRERRHPYGRERYFGQGHVFEQSKRSCSCRIQGLGRSNAGMGAVVAVLL
jgi:hypothetical protein